MSSPKTTKDNQQNRKHVGTKTKIKIWNRFVPNRRTIFDNAVHSTNFATLNNGFFSYQTFLPCALDSEEFLCPNGQISSSTRFSVFGQPGLSKFFNFLSNKLARILHFSVFFYYIFTVSICSKTVAKLTVIQTSTVPHNSCCTPNCLLCGFVLSRRAKGLSLNIPINKISQSLRNDHIWSGSISSIMQDILLQKLTVEN